MRAPAAGLALAAGSALAALLAGCGETPGPEDLLTLVEVEPAHDLALVPGAADSVAAQVAVTFRDWFTGSIVLEARVSASLAAGIAPLLEGDAEAHAAAWDTVMAATASLGFAVRPVAGYRTLIREPTLGFPVAVPAADSAGRPPAGVFLVAYLADVDEIEVRRGVDSLVVTPHGRERGILNDVAPIPLEVAR